MAKFMFLFRSNPAAFKALSPEQMQATVKKWNDWKDSLQKSGHLHQVGDRLDQSGKVIRGKDKEISDGPYVEVKDLVQGQMFVDAKDLSDATDIAKGCPIFEIDGSVEIRPIMSV